MAHLIATATRRRRSARDAAEYAWRASGRPASLERLGHASWVPELLVNVFAIVAVLAVAATWLAPAVVSGLALGWDTTIEGGPASAVHLSGPAWMYALFGVAFLAVAIAGAPYVVKATRRRRRHTPVLTLAPGVLTVLTPRRVDAGPTGSGPLKELPTSFEWRDVRFVEPSGDPEDPRPILGVRGAAAAAVGVESDAEDPVRIRIRGDDRDAAVLQHFLALPRERRQLGTEESLQLVRRVASATG